VRRIFAQLALPIALCIGSASHSFASNDCTCPKVPASGQGNTSCSASEANNRCTVDYNVFFERERRSVEFLSKAGVDSIRAPDPSVSAVETIARLKGRNQELTDAILIYLTVALSAQPSASDLGKVAKTIADTVHSQAVSGRIAAAFESSDTVSAGSDENLIRQPPNNLTLEGFATAGEVTGRIVPGCVELYVRDVWVMFKVAWSPYRLQPRCGR
jgi:hypothetical protein